MEIIMVMGITTAMEITMAMVTAGESISTIKKTDVTMTTVVNQGVTTVEMIDVTITEGIIIVETIIETAEETITETGDLILIILLL